MMAERSVGGRSTRLTLFEACLLIR